MDPLEVFRKYFVKDGDKYIWRDNLWWEVHSVDYTRTFDETAKPLARRKSGRAGETPT